ncbi:putative kinase inhibitor [Serratia entomophila]|uniref:YbhB/YbcL family Raf kinase inhibitor-like protein n=1 Tax=Serratia entomophila TaxID=42906 RepID=UPI0021784E85|nr:YbhB/YbcL family Raf kinase inhibitor-like protein [Serratia entomophila]CAI0758798.1 putative kinase inhibitor [Serratia entomophila]CAI1066418.1 putative kinase inhibitor [Serratia entomophila]CAI1083955.1 putative kinase inhibitor [Serratia entomophila]CAI1583038.1 putative kinase inhibitor [Serratia entomophila]CAI1587549.1 putative kinase inhibitor [Serratia entomophila]
MVRGLSTLALSGALCLALPGAAQAAGAFTLSSPAFQDGGLLAQKYAGATPGNASCTGENVSPPLSWANPPLGTKSFALLLSDPEGRGGLGVSHLVAYGIPASASAFAAGELTQGKGFVGGKNSPGTQVYHGPCPPAGSGFHHYTFVLIATDLPPDALRAGLTREQLLAALQDHAKGAAGIIGRFGQ